MVVPVTIITLFLLTLLYLALSFRVILYRRGHHISLGDANDPTLGRRIRAHGNFNEYVPLAVLLILTLELNNVDFFWPAGVATFLIIGRFFHAWALSSPQPKMFFRVAGMAFTFTSLIFALTGYVVNFFVPLLST